MAKNKDLTQAALKLGKQQATEVLEIRKVASLERQQALDERIKTLGLGSLVAMDNVEAGAEFLKAGGRHLSAGVLVAEGDSWFDYPWYDILSLLEDQHGYDVESVARKGDRVENMAYNGGQLLQFTRRIEKLLRRNTIPSAILLSGGGNDIAERFTSCLIMQIRLTGGLNQPVVNGIIDGRLRLAYATIIGAVTKICEDLAGKRIPILIHGYDHPVPDGRGYLGGAWILPGPWLSPGFEAKGYHALKVRKAIVKDLINQFNSMLESVAAIPTLDHVKYIDLRGTLSTGPNYKEWWDNELHPSRKGFQKIVERFAAEL